jgi:hypothetical protein
MAAPNRHTAGLDSNHNQIVGGLSNIPGVSVYDACRVGDGFPDIVVGYAGRTYLFEIKPSRRHKLNRKQRKFFGRWKGQVDVIYCLEDALAIMGIKVTA